MNPRFNFTVETPARLIADTIGFVMFLIVMFAAMWWLG